MDEPLDDEDVPVLERINKRVRLTEKENQNHRLDSDITKFDDDKKTHSKKTIKLTSAKNNKKRLIPSTRSNKQSNATWIRKYNIEDCCIQLDHYDPIYNTEKD